MKTFPRHQHLRLSLQRTSGSFCSGLLSYYYYLCVLEAKGPLHVRWAAIPNATGPSKIGPEGGLIRQRTRGRGLRRELDPALHQYYSISVHCTGTVVALGKCKFSSVL
jgi:hypothetical protein